MSDWSIGAQVDPGPQGTPFSESMGRWTQIRAQQEASAALAEQRRQLAEQRQGQADDATAMDRAAQPGFDTAAILAQLPGHLRPTAAKQLYEADKLAADSRDAKLKAAAADAEYGGSLAATWKHYGFSPSAGAILLQHSQANGHDIAPTLQMLGIQDLSQIGSVDPAKLSQIGEGLIQASSEQRKLATSEGSAKVTADAAAAALPGIQAKSAQEQAVAGGMVGGMTPDQQAADRRAAAQLRETQAYHGAELSNQRRTQNREDQKFQLTYGAGRDETGKALPEDPLARAIAENRVPPPSSRSMASGVGKALMERVMAINPTYDATQFPSRNKMRTAFTSGPQGQTLNSLNTAIEHLDQFVGFAKTMGNGQFQSSNELKNWVKTQLGDSAPTNFDGIKTVLSGEVAGALKKSGATDTEIEHVERSMKSAGSPAQLFDYATKVVIPALGSKAHTYDSQWKATMGEKDPFSVYTPGAKAVLDKYGAAPSAPGAPNKIGRFVVEVH